MTFVLVGAGNEWDLDKCPTFRVLHLSNEQIYGASFKKVLPMERFQIVDKEKGWKRRYKKTFLLIDVELTLFSKILSSR